MSSAFGLVGDLVKQEDLWNLFKKAIIAKLDLLQTDQWFTATWIEAGTAFDPTTMTVDSEPDGPSSGIVRFCLSPKVEAYTPKSEQASFRLRSAYCNFGPVPAADRYEKKSLLVKANVVLQGEGDFCSSTRGESTPGSTAAL